jgi:hypothetical protein
VTKAIYPRLSSPEGGLQPQRREWWAGTVRVQYEYINVYCVERHLVSQSSPFFNSPSRFSLHGYVRIMSNVMSSYDPEYWLNDPHDFDDGARELWPLRDPELANSDRIAFSVTLGPTAGMTGLYVMMDATTVSYDSEGLRHVQTEENWRRWSERIEAEESFTVGSTVPPPAPYVDYDSLARQALSREEENQQTGDGSILNQELCERALRMACRINSLSDGYERRPSVADAYAVLDSIYVALTDPSRRNNWRDVTYPSDRAPSLHRRTEFWGSSPDPHGNHILTLSSPRGIGEPEDNVDLDDHEDTENRDDLRLPHGQPLSISQGRISSLVAMVLGDNLRNLTRAVQTVQAETADQGRPLSVGVRLDCARSLSSFQHQVEVEVEPVNDA